MAATSIASRQHPFVQRCRRVAAGRGDAGDILLDGEHLIDDALTAGIRLHGALADARTAALADRLTQRGVPVYAATAAVLDAASPVRSPSGIVAIGAWSPRPAAEIISGATGVVIGLVDVQDPGNTGSIIRSADALGAAGVLALDATAHPGGWKTLRGAMGGTFRLPVGTGTSDDAIARARSRGMPVVATVAQGGMPLGSAAPALPALVLIGSEGAGLPAAIVDAADTRVTIPMRADTNSLNAATTAALVLWELTRRSREGHR